MVGHKMGLLEVPSKRFGVLFVDVFEMLPLINDDGRFVHESNVRRNVFFVDAQEIAIIAGLCEDFGSFAVGIAHVFVVFEFDEQIFVQIVDAEVFERRGRHLGEDRLPHIGFALCVLQSVKCVFRNGEQ